MFTKVYSERSRTKLLTILAVVLFAGNGLYALPDKIFTSDGIIIEGDEYSHVYIYDTPPDRTTVSMFGGWVSNLRSYDSSIFNMFGGTAETEAYNQSTFNIGGGTIYTINSWDSSNVNVFGGQVNGITAYDTATINVFDNANLFALFAHDSGVINMSGGITRRIGSAGFSTVNLFGGLVTDDLASGDSSIINVYGYNLGKSATGGKFGNGFVWGEWESNVPFNFDFYGPTTYSRVILYEIPEPATMLLFVVGSVFLRKRRTL